MRLAHKRSRRFTVLAAAMTLQATAQMAPLAASAQTTKRIPLTASQNPSGADLPFSQAVWAGDTLYVSGWLDPDLTTHTDTQSQAEGVLEDVQGFLKTQGLSLSDVVMMRVYLVGAADPANSGSRMDIQGVRAAEREFFGTEAQPNKPACTTVHVLRSGQSAVLVEFDFVVVRPKPSPGA
jgi:enamine deaminase RidA (YjgF/YER057c/UK114 family)